MYVQLFASDAQAQMFLKDETVKAKLANAKKLSDVRPKDYDAILYIGGQGPMFDLANDPVNAGIVSEASGPVHFTSRLTNVGLVLERQ